MTFNIHSWCPETELLLQEHHVTKQEDKVLIPKLVKLCKKLERAVHACGHEQLTCCNCGAVRNDSDKLTNNTERVDPVPLSAGTFQCPLCGQENHWRRISRFVTT